ncbi:ATP-binding protein [Streptomyces sp. IBSNAI002]|uniref:ATP-binding protein n=1 Tax=Streptomyces sp. IBSNAI002 TaxID=3457500 RepID=UPI003FD25EF7
MADATPARRKGPRRLRLPRPPSPTIRGRIALGITAVAVLTSAGVLTCVLFLTRIGAIAVAYGNVLPTSETPAGPPDSGEGNEAQAPDPGDAVVPLRLIEQTTFDHMLFWSAAGMLVLCLSAGVLGWWVAGRSLRPLRAVTAAARRIGEQNLDERLRLTGPRDEVTELAETFDAMLGRLERAFTAQRRFAAHVSHELRTPLAAVRTGLEVGLADPQPPGIAEVRRELLGVQDRAEALVATLLLLARSDHGIALGEREPVDLGALVDEVAAEARAAARQAPGTPVTVRVHRYSAAGRAGHAGSRNVTGDPVLLRHLLANLASNAVRHNRPGGSVDIELRDRSVTVANTGDPVPADRVPGLTEPFTRLRADRTDHTGHGLGLALVRSIADAHGADLGITPGAGGGLHVTVRFPPPAEPAEPAEPAVPARQPWQRPRA